jgi:hypothetical protein
MAQSLKPECKHKEPKCSGRTVSLRTSWSAKDAEGSRECSELQLPCAGGESTQMKPVIITFLVHHLWSWAITWSPQEPTSSNNYTALPGDPGYLNLRGLGVTPPWPPLTHTTYPAANVSCGHEDTNASLDFSQKSLALNVWKTAKNRACLLQWPSTPSPSQRATMLSV